ELIPQNICEFYCLIPIARIGNALSVAMADPLNVFAIDDIKLMTGMEIVPTIATETDILEILKAYYSNKSGMTEVLDDVDDVEVAHEKMEEMDLDQLGGASQADEAPVIKIVNIVLKEAIDSKASDIHIEPMEKTLSIRYRIDGVLHQKVSPPKALQNAIISRLKIMAKLDIAERRLPQDGRFRIKIKGKNIDFRFSTLPTVYGEKVVMRILDKSALNLDMTKLGFTPNALKTFKEALTRPYGIILVTGPTGSGKTTSLYSALSILNTTEKNLVTVEDPVEYQLAGINQVQCNADIGLTFASALRSILRQDPNIVMIGEIRDFETADIAIKASLTGHLVLSTLHTNDAPSAIARLDDMGVEPFLISSSLICVQAQRLGRKICEKCKEPLPLDKEILKQAQIPSKYYEDPNFITYQGKGCRSCSNTGNSGRSSIVEVFAVNDEIRKLVVQRKSSEIIKKIAVEQGMLTLRMAALRKVIEGSMSLKEALRVTSPDELEDIQIPEY
ncbi:MAG: type II secretion system ATPase GspE, partial [Candidatus Aureabacteria bacterium]|nr:type II secretion system ATPase GspE [Candidatus Auribacterota bacterium]